MGVNDSDKSVNRDRTVKDKDKDYSGSNRDPAKDAADKAVKAVDAIHDANRPKRP